MRVARPILANIVLVVVILAALVAGVIYLTHPFQSSASAAAIQLTSTVQKGVVSATISASGSIAPVHEVSSSFAVAGTVATVAVKPGDVVPAGALLGTLDTSSFSAALASARTKLSNANSQLAYATASLASATTAAAQPPAPSPTSSGQNSVASAQSQVASAASQVSTAQDAVDSATGNLAAATLTAPISGVVIAVSGAPGSRAQAGSPALAVSPSGTVSTQAGPSTPSGFVTIADTTILTVTANIAEADITSVALGQAATVAFPALSGASTPAKVTAIAPTATSSSSVVSYATTLTLDAVPKNLRLGQSAQVTITTRTSGTSVLYVPTAAITTTNGASTVKIVAHDGTTTSTTVALGVVGDVGTEITSGLTAGETVVIGTVSATQSSTTNTRSPFGPGTRGGFGGGGGGGAGGGTPRTP
jgi:macrolide-specific efflux system membrane fusion protein